MLEPGRCNSDPSPSSLDIAGIGGNDARYEVENQHLRECVSLLQLELKGVRAAAHEALAASHSQLKANNDDLESLKRSNRELTQQLDLANAANAQLEARNAWLEEQLRAVGIAHPEAGECADMATDGAENEDPVCSLSHSLSLARTCSHASEASQQVDGGTFAPAQQQQQPGTAPADQFTFSPVSPRALAAAAEEANDGMMPPKRRRAPPSAPPMAPPAPRRLTYGCSPHFHELRLAYDQVLASSQASEDPVDRWVRTVLSSTSAVDTDPKNVEPVLAGLAELCESNGLPLPLHRLGPCQFQLGGTAPGRGGARLRVRLVNGRLMARSGPAWLDFFAWLERQVMHSDRQPSA